MSKKKRTVIILTVTTTIVTILLSMVSIKLPPTLDWLLSSTYCPNGHDDTDVVSSTAVKDQTIAGYKIISDSSISWYEHIMTYIMLKYLLPVRDICNSGNSSISNSNGNKSSSFNNSSNDDEEASFVDNTTTTTLDLFEQYRLARSHLGIDKWGCDPLWWYHQSLTLHNVTMYSDPLDFIAFPWRTSTAGDNMNEMPEIINTKQGDVMPVIHVDTWKLHWSSWNKPVINMYINHIQIKTLFDLSREEDIQITEKHAEKEKVAVTYDETHDDASFPLHQLLPHFIKHFTKSTLIKFIDLLPPPPTEPGIYPKFGHIRITDVTFETYVSLLSPSQQNTQQHGVIGPSNNSSSCTSSKPSPIKHVKIGKTISMPIELLELLANETLEKCTQGIEQMDFPKFMMKEVLFQTYINSLISASDEIAEGTSKFIDDLKHNFVHALDNASQWTEEQIDKIQIFFVEEILSSWPPWQKKKNQGDIKNSSIDTEEEGGGPDKKYYIKKWLDDVGQKFKQIMDEHKHKEVDNVQEEKKTGGSFFDFLLPFKTDQSLFIWDDILEEWINNSVE